MYFYMKTKIITLFAVLSILLLGANFVSAEDYNFECSNLNLVADGVGMQTGSGTINLNVPGEPELGLLYWAVRGQGDANINVNNVSILGDLIKPPFVNPVWWSLAYSYVFDFTSHVSEGSNIWELTGLSRIPGIKDPSAAAAFVVYEDENVENIIQIKSINDFSYIGLNVPLNQSDPVNFEFEATCEDRTAKIILAVGDAEPLPRTDKIWYQTGVGTAPSYIIGTGNILAENELKSAQGPEADVYQTEITIPADHDYLSIQVESPYPNGVGDSLILISTAMVLECELKKSCEKIVCEDYTYSNCPNSCGKICISSFCSGVPPHITCTDDCEGEGSCYTLDNKKSKKDTQIIQYCEPLWTCGGWSECNDDVQTRNCEDANSCEFSYNKPGETIGCSEVQVLEKEPETNVVLWVLLGLLILLILILIVLGVL